MVCEVRQTGADHAPPVHALVRVEALVLDRDDRVLDVRRDVLRIDEDPVLVAGKGCYVDDIQLPGMLYLAFLRTTYPHAKIISITTNAAKAMAGVLTVVIGEDVKQLNIPVAPMVPLHRAREIFDGRCALASIPHSRSIRSARSLIRSPASNPAENAGALLQRCR